MAFISMVILLIALAVIAWGILMLVSGIILEVRVRKRENNNVRPVLRALPVVLIAVGFTAAAVPTGVIVHTYHRARAESNVEYSGIAIRIPAEYADDGYFGMYDGKKLTEIRSIDLHGNSAEIDGDVWGAFVYSEDSYAKIYKLKNDTGYDMFMIYGSIYAYEQDIPEITGYYQTAPLEIKLKYSEDEANGAKYEYRDCSLTKEDFYRIKEFVNDPPENAPEYSSSENKKTNLTTGVPGQLMKIPSEYVDFRFFVYASSHDNLYSEQISIIRVTDGTYAVTKDYNISSSSSAVFLDESMDKTLEAQISGFTELL